MTLTQLLEPLMVVAAVAAIAGAVRMFMSVAADNEVESRDLVLIGAGFGGLLVGLGVAFLDAALNGVGRSFEWSDWWSSPRVLWQLPWEGQQAWLTAACAVGVVAAVALAATAQAVAPRAVQSSSRYRSYTATSGGNDGARGTMIAAAYMIAFAAIVVGGYIVARLTHSATGAMWAAAAVRSVDDSLYLTANLMKLLGAVVFAASLFMGGLGSWSLSGKVGMIVGAVIFGLGMLIEWIVPIRNFIPIAILIAIVALLGGTGTAASKK